MTDMTPEGLRKQIVTAIEDVFVHTLEVKLEQDVPMLADKLLQLFSAFADEITGDNVEEFPNDGAAQYGQRVGYNWAKDEVRKRKAHLIGKETV